METGRKSKIKIHKNTKIRNENSFLPYPVESCSKISAGMLGKGILKSLQSRSGPGGRPIKGQVVASENEVYAVKFEPVPGEKPKVLVKLFNQGRVQTQEIYLVGKAINFGVRPYLLCKCGRATQKLYHRPGCHGFSCRTCLSLRYRLQNINKKAPWSRIRYWIDRLAKLEELKAGLKRKPLMYRGRVTTRFMAFLKAKVKWSFSNEAGRAMFGELRLRDELESQRI